MVAKIIGELNDSYIKAVKVRGEFAIIPHGVEHTPVADKERTSSCWNRRAPSIPEPSRTRGPSPSSSGSDRRLRLGCRLAFPELAAR